MDYEQATSNKKMESVSGSIYQQISRNSGLVSGLMELLTLVEEKLVPITKNDPEPPPSKSQLDDLPPAPEAYSLAAEAIANNNSKLDIAIHRVRNMLYRIDL